MLPVAGRSKFVDLGRFVIWGSCWAIGHSSCRSAFGIHSSGSFGLIPMRQRCCTPNKSQSGGRAKSNFPNPKTKNADDLLICLEVGEPFISGCVWFIQGNLRKEPWARTCLQDFQLRANQLRKFAWNFFSFWVFDQMLYACWYVSVHVAYWNIFVCILNWRDPRDVSYGVRWNVLGNNKTMMQLWNFIVEKVFQLIIHRKLLYVGRDCPSGTYFFSFPGVYNICMLYNICMYTSCAWRVQRTSRLAFY